MPQSGTPYTILNVPQNLPDEQIETEIGSLTSLIEF